jgi:hypothetical protein
MPFLHVYRSSRFAILEVEEADDDVLSHAMPTSLSTSEFHVKPQIK